MYLVMFLSAPVSKSDTSGSVNRVDLNQTAWFSMASGDNPSFKKQSPGEGRYICYAWVSHRWCFPVSFLFACGDPLLRDVLQPFTVDNCTRSVVKNIPLLPQDPIQWHSHFGTDTSCANRLVPSEGCAWYPRAGLDIGEAAMLLSRHLAFLLCPETPTEAGVGEFGKEHACLEA